MEELRLLICLDATHKTNMYNFQLFSFVAQNSYGQAVPIAFLTTSDGRMDMLKIFLYEFKKFILGSEHS